MHPTIVQDTPNEIIRDLLHATMPDGSIIRVAVKADTMLDQFDAGHVPEELKRLLRLGIDAEIRTIRNHKRRLAELAAKLNTTPDRG